MDHALSVRPLACLLGLALLAGMAPAARSQEPWDAPEASAGPRLLLVDVFVTDRKGAPIEGLPREAFRLSEDGRPVAFTFFHEARDGESRPVDGPGDAVRDADRTGLAVLFDELHTRPADRNRLLRDLRPLVEEEASRDVPVLLAVNDGSISVIQSWTTDRLDLRGALEKIELRDVRAEIPEMERQVVTCLISPGSPGCPYDAREAMHRLVVPYIEEARRSAESAILGLENLVLDFAHDPGRKSVILVGSGLPLTPASEIQALLGGRGMGLPSSMHDLRIPLDKLTEAANGNRVTVYAILPDVVSPGLSPGSARGSMMPGAGLDAYLHERRQNLQSGLVAVTAATGGYLGTSSAYLLQWARADQRSFYVLGYAPDRRPDDRHHRLKVSVEGKRQVVRHREGIVDLPVTSPR
jgi:VWFA-related protein